MIHDTTFQGPDADKDGMNEKQSAIAFVIFCLDVGLMQCLDIDASIACQTDVFTCDDAQP